ncbi:hypothetical protein EUX98_g8711 [Antrodiella citrinella]|uniref:DUF4218 domain-containing protein n=1 Tax=Antrodiella citrinella TaxID=2447956 RepID=A0A4S4M3U2_9APHY|nr:hypothetical protein EUX98_g8711 [Antrodiella citrinella]
MVKPKGPKLVACTCTGCGQFTHTDQFGLELPGMLQPAQTRKKHVLADKTAEGTQKHGEAMLTLHTLGLGSLDVRTKLRSGKVVTTDANAAEPDVIVPGPSGPPTDNTAMSNIAIDNDSEIQSHLRILRFMNAHISLMRARVRDDLVLVFSTPPTTLVESPSPITSSSTNHAYLEYHVWLFSTTKQLEELPGLGHKEISGQKAGMMKLVQKELSRLECIKFSSWNHAQVAAGLYCFDDMISKRQGPPPHVYNSDPAHPLDPYPRLCTFIETDKGPCSAPLVKQYVNAEGRVAYRPIKTFGYQGAFTWLATLLARPGLDSVLGSAWRVPMQTSRPAFVSDGRWRDIWDAPAIQEFIGPDGTSLFSLQADGSMHLVFSLFVDWFNPYGNKKAGKSHSLGAIYMACLNLPPHLRYLPENIYLVGIMPGPKEASLHQLNHYLRPLVDDLVVLWEQGVYFTRTASSPAGRLVRAAMIPLVCDLPALRKTAGFAGHSASFFCSFCRLRLAEINNLQRELWGTANRTWASHMSAAREWRDATSERERTQVFEEFGIRWSELLRLRYWDPTRYALVDAMHNLFLGVLRHHCMEVFGINVKGGSGSTKVHPHTPDEQSAWLEKVVKGIRKEGKTKAINAVVAARKGYVVAVAQRNGVSPGDKLTKRAYATALVEWYLQSPGREICLPPVMKDATADFRLDEIDVSRAHILDFDVLSHIRDDIKKTVYPSWIERPPSNFGSPGHGKLKADQWRTVSTISLVITLIRLWGHASASEQEQKMLKNFIHLVIAVQHASRRSISLADVVAYDTHMYAYVSGLRTLYDHQLVPNHHLSLHLTGCLRLFGVVHSWWAFPFERYNGVIGRLKNNGRTDEMPLTFMRYFCIGANLRWFMATFDWQESEISATRAFMSTFGRRGPGTLNADLDALFHGTSHAEEVSTEYDSSKERKLGDKIYQRLLRRINQGATHRFEAFGSPGTSRAWLNSDVVYVPTAHYRGVLYGTPHGSRRNCHILYTHPSSGNVSAGQISNIFQHCRIEDDRKIVETFLLVKTYKSLTGPDAEVDPFRKFSALGAHLCYNTLEDVQLIRLDDIVSHFAAYTYTPEDIEQECIVVLSVNRN